MFRKRIKKISLSLIATMMILVGLGFTNPVSANEETHEEKSDEISADTIEAATIKQDGVELNRYNLLAKSDRLIAIEAVVRGEITRREEDVDIARGLVDDVAAGGLKDNLIVRLDAIIPDPNAPDIDGAVEQAENSKLQGDVDAARDLIVALPTPIIVGRFRDDLLIRLDNIIVITPVDSETVIEDYIGEYDGVYHGVTRTMVDTNDTIKYRTLVGGSWIDWTSNYLVFKNVGEYLVQVLVENPNFDSRIIEATVTITPKEATITVNDSEKVYGVADPVFTGTDEGLVAGDTLEDLAYVRVGTDEDVGEYVDVLSATFEDDPNYDVSVINANFTIHPIVTVIYEDTKGNELDKLTLSDQLGEDWTSKQEYFNGYKFKEVLDDAATFGKYTEEAQEVTYVYYKVIPATEIEDAAITKIPATEIEDTATTKIPATEIEDTATTKIPATEIEDTATKVDTKKETAKDKKLPSTGMSNTFTIMNMMMIGAGVVLKTLNKKEED